MANLGDIVIYQPKDGSSLCPGIVTRVHSDGSVDLQTFLRGCEGTISIYKAQAGSGLGGFTPANPASSQTPWQGPVDAAGYNLNNVGVINNNLGMNINGTTTTTARIRYQSGGDIVVYKADDNTFATYVQLQYAAGATDPYIRSTSSRVNFINAGIVTNAASTFHGALTVDTGDITTQTGTAKITAGGMITANAGITLKGIPTSAGSAGSGVVWCDTANGNVLKLS